MKYLMVLVALASCVMDEVDDELGETSADVTSSNKLASNKLATNKLATAKLAAAKLAGAGLAGSSLIETAAGRDVLTYVVRCALAANQTVVFRSSNGASYSFAGEIGLASAWTTRALTTSEQRWVSACILARTNYYGVQVNLSLRGDHPALGATFGEVLQYGAAEAAFYGNIFIPEQPEYACIGVMKEIGIGSPSYPLRQCAVQNGKSGITMCGFTYTGGCGVIDSLLAPACDSLLAPYTNCHPPRKSGTAATTYHEVITVELPGGLL
ncbi:MAG: hypothetical protein ABI678_22910 [Kofleriaceae bacterium]